MRISRVTWCEQHYQELEEQGLGIERDVVMDASALAEDKKMCWEEIRDNFKPTPRLSVA